MFFVRNSIPSIIKVIPYLATLYYLEIIYFLYKSFMIEDKFFSIIIILLSTIFLSGHLIFLAEKNRTSRIMHLLIIDCHLSYSIFFFIKIIIEKINFDVSLEMLLIFRVVMSALEIFQLYFLTSPKVRKKYQYSKYF